MSNTTQVCNRFRLDVHGNIAVITALGATMLAGVAGVALLAAQDVRQQTAMQAALDAGVLAGTALPFGIPAERRVAAAELAFYANIEDATFGTESAKDGVEFSADAAPKPTFSVSKSQVSGQAVAKVENSFAATIGIAEVDINSFAQAEKMASEPVCVLALNKTSPNSIYVYGNAELNVNGCSVQANSTNGSGLQMDGNSSKATALQFGVSGSYGGNNDDWTPKPITGTEPIDDPYASLPIPQPGSCIVASGKLNAGNATLEPGTYCGGLTISSGAHVTLQPGVYIIKDGPLTISSGAFVMGQEVIFAFVGANARLDMKSDATLKITSPVSGTYKNIQMMSDRDLSESKFQEEWATVLSGAKLDYDGVIYLPEQQFWVSGTSHDAVIKGSSPSMVLVVDSVWAQGNAVFDLRREDKRGTGGDGVYATFGYGARLVR